MNHTAAYLKDLLYRYDCVILPGFGAFLSQRKPAFIQENSQHFYPPSKVISFNEQLQHNDGLLANYIASVEKCSFKEAVDKIEIYVTNLKNSLYNQEVYLKNIGAFFTSGEGRLQFKPDSQTNFLPEAFGLSSITTPAVILQAPEREVLKEQVEVLEEKTPIAFTPEKRKERNYSRYAATAAIIIGITGLLSYTGIQWRNSQVADANFMTRTEVAKDMDHLIQEATFEISNPLPAINLAVANLKEKKTTESSTVYGYKYHIVAGAFRIKENAINRKEHLQANGYQARLIGKNKYGLHQVVYNSYATRYEALQALKNIKHSENRRAWLLIASIQN
ncbi:SPOR domain-containing protein [Aquimarina sp. ERC-38]|uniref:HU domain-containing protein n=1 Tax=Aquimarina sp. ERC-38 TaxID=2949996 RepID=UPI002245ED49|nr:SPOR domain-containing protein [Aquimarina sp. ERC-38]UZO81656.1 SPOR domain-containing protein [Aquimarina sp. ERC-38]